MGARCIPWVRSSSRHCLPWPTFSLSFAARAASSGYLSQPTGFTRALLEAIHLAFQKYLALDQASAAERRARLMLIAAKTLRPSMT